ncbi:U-box domain-containing protein 1 [Cocos nucifera]|uniref:U-box domain-containing protein 1 n=1 Tax=Cocos nucifera TaxID=13894 RepID=A0A8K0MXT0_COCNU|nr:U-box domain-containing protein 1 [Cocos nucifera]
MEAKLRTAASLVKRPNSAEEADSAAEAIAEIRLLSKHDPEIRSLLTDAGAVPLLAARLLPGGGHHSPPSQDNTAAALLNHSISSRETLMSTPGRSIKDALKALFGIALYPLNRPALVDLGAVPALFSLVVNDGRTGVVEDATAVIAQAAGCYESVDDFREVAGVRVLVDLVDAGRGASGRARENAAAALLLNLVMSGGEEAAADVREIEVAKTALRELAGGGGSVRATSKAESLLRAFESGHGGRFPDLKANSATPPQLSALSAATTVNN